MEESVSRAKVAIVTGGSRGIGFETVRLFLEAGFSVATCAVSKTNLDQAASELGGTGRLFTAVADVSDYQAVKKFVDAVRREFGQVDVLVNNAGTVWAGEFVRQAVKSINEVIDVNVKGVLFMTRAVLPIMLEQKRGIIINVSSGAGQIGFPGITTYSASKFAVNGFTESLAREVESHGIRVYAICPGSVATDMQKRVSGRKEGMPPQDVARKILDLAGPKPPIRSGECLEI